MKRPAFVLLSLVLAAPFFNNPVSAQEWRPISEITGYEIGVIENAAKKPATRVLAEGDEFRIDQGLIAVRFKNGDVGYYGYGRKSGYKINKDKERWDQPSKEQETADSVVKRDALFLEEWYGKWTRAPAQRLTAAEVQEVDWLVNQHLDFISGNSNDLEKGTTNILTFFARAGNRWFSRAEALIPQLNTRSALEFYELYIEYAMRREDSIRDEDLPSESDIKQALQKLIVLLQQYDERFVLFTQVRKTLKQYYPQDYALLKAAGKIQEQLQGWDPETGLQ